MSNSPTNATAIDAQKGDGDISISTIFRSQNTSQPNIVEK